jgi:hypothetical protein
MSEVEHLRRILAATTHYLLTFADFVTDNGTYTGTDRRTDDTAGKYGACNSTADCTYGGILLTCSHITAATQTNYQYCSQRTGCESIDGIHVQAPYFKN